MSIPEAKHLARAMRRHSEGAVRVHGQRIEKGLVAQIDPLVVSLIGHEVEIEADSLLLGVNVRIFDAQYGIAEGDTVLLSRLDDGDWFVIDVISDIDETEQTTGGDLELDGKIVWAPGDTNLYRSGANKLRTDDDFQARSLYAYGGAPGGGVWSQRQQAGEVGYASWVGVDGGAQDAYDRFEILAGGQINWGPGNAAPDTMLFRSSPGWVAATPNLSTGNFQTSGWMLAGSDLYMRNASPHIWFGPSDDTSLYRFATGFLATAGDFMANGQAAGQISMQSMGGVPYIFFGSAQDTNLYRSAADTLSTDDAFETRLNYLYPGANMAGVYPKLSSVNGLGAAIGWNFSGGNAEMNFWNTYETHGGGVPSFQFRQMTGAGTSAHCLSIGGDGKLTIGQPADTTLYRAAANSLKTDVSFTAGQGLVGMQNVFVDNSNGGYRLYFGSALDTSLYRSNPNQLTTQGFTCDYLYVDAGVTAQQVLIDGGAIYWGTVGDTNLYRYAANTLRTDDAFWVGVGQPLIVNSGDGNSQIEFAWQGSARQYRHSIQTHHNGGVDSSNAMDFYIWTTDAGPDNLPTYRTLRLTGDGKVWIGNALDTNLYRAGANILGVYLAFRAQGDVTANANATGGFTANTVAIGHTGSGYGPSIIFGNANARLYYDGASALRTPNNLIVDGTLSAGVFSPASISTPGNVAVGGQITFGVGDVNLYRRGQDNLQTDDTFWALQNVVTGGKVYFNTNLVPVISSAGTDFTISHQTWAPSFVATNAVYVDYGNGGSRLYFGNDAAYSIYRDSANSQLRTPNNLYADGSISAGGTIIASSYVQGIGMVYGNAGVSVYDTGAGTWRLLDGYGGGIRSSGHFWTTAGYSLVSAQNTYNRSTSSMVCLGVNDEVQLAYYSGALRINVPVYFDSIAVKSGESWTNVTYVNGWGGYGAPFFGVQFRKLASGLVVMRGLAQGGAAYTSICQLPPSYRPAAGTRLIFEQACSGGRVRIDIADDGYCYVVNDGLTGSAVGFTSFAGISFYAES